VEKLEDLAYKKHLDEKLGEEQHEYLESDLLTLPIISYYFLRFTLVFIEFLTY